MIKKINENLLLTFNTIHYKCLSPREREVLSYIIEGYTSLYIANKLGIKETAIEQIIVRIKYKLEIFPEKDKNSRILMVLKGIEVLKNENNTTISRNY